MNKILTSPLSIAPMIDWSYTHFRVLMRFLAPEALLYTEMQTTGAIQNNPLRALDFHSMEHPVAIQLGGCYPLALAECAKMAEQAGFDEININLRCPSDKVQAGRFGACLMNEPIQVAACIEAMRKAVTIPVTAKTRIGIDNQESYEFFSAFAHLLVDAGCQKLIVHARKAWLHGLNPKQNRTVPPVHYDFVYKIKRELPEIPVHINGNITHITEINAHLQQVDGVMLGRLACDNPYKIAQIHHVLYPGLKLPTRSEIFQLYLKYLLEEHSKGVSLALLVKPVFSLAFGLPGAGKWKQQLMTILQTKNVFLFEKLADYLFEIESSVCLNEG